MNKQKESILAATDRWIKAVLPELNKLDQDALNQVYMRGPFAGWSIEELKNFVKQLKENNDNYPIRK